jgi:uncharacterized membrane protein
MMCIDWLGASFAAVANKEHKQHLRHDDSGALRVVVPAVSSMGYVSGVLDNLMPYVCKDRNAALHLQSTLAKLLLTLDSVAAREKIMVILHQLIKRARPQLAVSDVELLERRASVLLEGVSNNTGENARLYNNNPWVSRAV